MEMLYSRFYVRPCSHCSGAAALRLQDSFPFQTIVARWFRWLSCCGCARFVSFKVAAAPQRVPFTLLFLGYNCDWLMWRRQFCCCCCCSVFFRSFSVVCVPRYVLIFPGDVLRGPWPRPAHSSYVYVCVDPLYQYGWENWFGGSSKTSRSPADWLGPPPKVESWERRPSTWDWYSAM